MKKNIILLFLFLMSNLNYSQTLFDVINNSESEMAIQTSLSSIPSSYNQKYTIYEYRNGSLKNDLLEKKPQTFTLKLNKKEIFFTKRNLYSQFNVKSQSNIQSNLNFINYEGIVDKNTTVCLYVSEKQLSGTIIDKSSNKVSTIEEYVSPSHYSSLKVNDISDIKIEISCDTEDKPFPLEMVNLKTEQLGLDEACVKIYFEVDNDIYKRFNSLNETIDFVNGLFSQVKLLYTNENINIEISEIFVWDVDSPYTCTSSNQCLTQFYETTPDFNGDLGHLLSLKASGGIAYLDGLCHPVQQAKRAFSSISTGYNQYPYYSWSVMVVAHEIGHNLGSRHTHACVWNGNNTAIDGCAGFTEGNCPLPSNPQGGGTIMSYCHLQNVGINFSKGFGEQPANVIRNFIKDADCVTKCDDNNDGGNDEVDSTLVQILIKFDEYPMEIDWSVTDENGTVLWQNDTIYGKNLNNKTISLSKYLKNGDYSFKITDTYGDGICCEYGIGVVNVLIDGTNRKIISQFGETETFNFTLPFVDNESCPKINFTEHNITSYSNIQDKGTVEIKDKYEIKISNNAWKKIEFPYNVTENTILEFEFLSTQQGEIHGIGFDDNDAITSSLTFKTFGTQRWGYNVNLDNDYELGRWKKYKINVGEYYTGEFKYLFFTSDKDLAPFDCNSFFKNIKVYEKEECN